MSDYLFKRSLRQFTFPPVTDESVRVSAAQLVLVVIVVIILKWQMVSSCGFCLYLSDHRWFWASFNTYIGYLHFSSFNCLYISLPIFLLDFWSLFHQFIGTLCILAILTLNLWEMSFPISYLFLYFVYNSYYLIT